MSIQVKKTGSLERGQGITEESADEVPPDRPGLAVIIVVIRMPLNGGRLFSRLFSVYGIPTLV
ncbi:MAG: hypothetical protein IJJ45_02245 [Clostridia bacterium]|nr:hypothetical protein [Clostridia bacterium]